MVKQHTTARHATDDDRHQPPPKPPLKRKRRPSRLFWLGSRLFVLLALLGVVAYFVPPLIGSTGLWKSLLASAAPEIAKQIDIKSLQLSWFSPIEVRGLVVRDPSGQPLAEVPLIKSHKTLLAIALNSRDLGTFDIDQPRAKIVLRPSGSNIEDFLAKLPKSEDKKSEGKSSNTGIGLTISNGTVDFDDQVAGRQWRVENLSVDVTSPAATDQPKTGKLSASLKSAIDGAAVGQIAVEFHLQSAADKKSPLASGQAQITLVNLPTEVAEGAVRRFAEDIRPRGPLTLQAIGALKPDGALQLLVNNLATPGISIAAPAILTTDQPTIEITSGQGAVQFAGGQLTVPNLQLVSNLLTIGGKGSAAVGKSAGGEFQINGQVNVAALSRQLPATLHIRPDSKLDSGLAEFTLTSQTIADGRRWTGSLKTRDFRGVAAGRQIEFDQPLQIDFGVRQTAAGPVIDQLVGQASFLRLEGRGSLADGNLSATTNLDKLVEELERLIDWGDTRLEGTLAADLRWKHDPAAGWNATADARATNFKLTSPGLAPWQEPNLRLSANVQGDLADSKLAQINAVKIGIEAGADRFSAELAEAVKSPSVASIWPVKFALRGDLAAWRTRLQPFAPLPGWQIAGAIEAGGAARISPQETELGQTSVQVSQLAAVHLTTAADGTVHEALAIREPVVKIETSGAWSQPKATLALGSTTFASSAVAFRADGVRAVLGKEPSLVGVIDLRGDLARITSWFPSPQPTSRIEGALTSHVDIGYRGQSLAAAWTADVENLRYLVAPGATGGVSPATRTTLTSAPGAGVSPAWQPLWDEPKISFAGQGSFDPATSTLKIERTTLASSVASLGAAGSLTKLASGSPEIDLNGEIAYDLGAVTQEIKSHADQPAPRSTALPFSLDTLQLAGKEKRPFVLKGPLFAAASGLTPTSIPAGGARQPAGDVAMLSSALAGEASLAWEGAQYVGLVAGPAEFRAKLAGGIVQIGPLDIPLAEGRLTTAPRLLLNQREPTVVIDRGPVLTKVRISPEMCSLWMKYVAPMVAQATRAEGSLSLSLEGANLPLAAPLASDVAGTLTIQSARIGPGPFGQELQTMARELFSFLGAASSQPSTNGQPSGGSSPLAVLSFPQQDVPFEVKNGVAYHRGLKVDLGELEITTQGTVNLQTEEFDLIASIGLPESLFRGREGILAAFKGQPLQLPIRGSFNRPPDLSKALAGLFQQNAGSAVRNVIGNQIERRLQGDGGLLQRGESAVDRNAGGLLQRGEGLLQRELGQGLNRFFNPGQPASPQQPPAAPR